MSSSKPSHSLVAGGLRPVHWCSGCGAAHCRHGRWLRMSLVSRSLTTSARSTRGRDLGVTFGIPASMRRQGTRHDRPRTKRLAEAAILMTIASPMRAALSATRKLHRNSKPRLNRSESKRGQHPDPSGIHDAVRGDRFGCTTVPGTEAAVIGCCSGRRRRAGRNSPPAARPRRRSRRRHCRPLPAPRCPRR
jgi:hypothetical protein